MNNKTNEKLNAKDMITVGVFATLLTLVKVIVGFIGMIPVLNAVLPAITAIVVAPIYGLFVKKVTKFRMITILTSTLGALCFLMGYGIFSLIGCIILGFIADVITRTGDYKNQARIDLGYAVQSLWGITMYIQIWLMGDAYFEELSLSMGADFASKFQKYVPWYSVFWLIGLTVICAYIGMFFAKKILKKHFTRVGE